MFKNKYDMTPYASAEFASVLFKIIVRFLCTFYVHTEKTESRCTVFVRVTDVFERLLHALALVNVVIVF